LEYNFVLHVSTAALLSFYRRFLQYCLVHLQFNIHAPFNLLLLIWFCDTVMCKDNKMWQKYI